MSNINKGLITNLYKDEPGLALKEKQAFRPAPHAELNHNEVHHNDFHSALSNAMNSSSKVKEFVHLYEPHEYAGMKTFLSPDKASGYAVKPDGDIVSVFSTQKGRGDALVQHAVKNGGSKLDAFDGYLPGFYQKHGFSEYKREKNWTPGGPDVVYMKHKNSKKLAASEDMAHVMCKSEYYKNSKLLQKSEEQIQSKPQEPSLLYMAYDGDNAGRLVGRAILADDVNQLSEVSSKIAHGHEVVHHWVEAHNGQIISGGGDEGSFAISPKALEDIEILRKDYQHSTGLTMTVGIGQSISQAGKALMVGKLRGKDRVCIFDQSVEEEYAKAQDEATNGTATGEGKKLGELYLKPEGESNMKESELQESDLQTDENHDCPYCQEMDETNTEDPDHCKYCHDLDQESEHTCPYCEEYDAEGQEHDPSAEGHPDDCPYCQEMSEQTDENPDNAVVGDQEEPPVDDSAIADEIVETTPDGVAPSDILEQLENQPEDEGQQAAQDDGVSHPDDFNDNTPGDMGLAEDDEAPESPDLTGVLKDGLDSHAENIQREKVVQLVSEALEGFKGCKDIIEKAQTQAPQLYQSSIAMLKAMIEMAKMLGLAPQEAQEQPEQTPEEPAQDVQEQNDPHPIDGDPDQGKQMGR